MTIWISIIISLRRRANRPPIGAVFWALGLASRLSVTGGSILATKHNLSTTGPGEIRAESESDACIFCHTPHFAKSSAPRWNRYSSGAVYTPYSSATMKAKVGQPSGSSKLCLSCHDGTIALGMLISGKEAGLPDIRMVGGVTSLPLGASRLGTDLADDHPISFTFDSTLAAANGQLRHPMSLTGRVRLEDGKVQCTSCHDPHNDQFGKFLVQNNTGSALCLTCHAPRYWEASSHKLSARAWNGSGVNPWPHTRETTVANNACENCHTPHNAGSKPHLLNYAGEEQNCFSCHNGNVALLNIQGEFNKLSVHPIANTSGVHDPAEDTVNPPRHVECVDCHNPHAVNNTVAAMSGALAGVSGVNFSGSVVNSVAKDYELCFRCHADSTARAPARVARRYPQTNTRLEFTPANVSFHPVATAGRNPNVMSLIAPLTTASMISCTSCHNNNQGPGAGGVGPNGPHGSAYSPLLERRLELTDFNSGSPSVLYQLCFKCHDWNSIRNNDSFSDHDRHVRELQTACTTCHDPHGAPNPHLINFNTSYVTPNSKGVMQFVSTGGLQGSCSLACHNKDHDNARYGKMITLPNQEPERRARTANQISTQTSQLRR